MNTQNKTTLLYKLYSPRSVSMTFEDKEGFFQILEWLWLEFWGESFGNGNTPEAHL